YDLAKSFELDKATGALIARVLPGSPAAKAGLQVGDIVRSVNGEEVRASSDLPVMVGAIAPGKEITLGVWRKGKETDIKVQLGSADGNAQSDDEAGSGQPPAGGDTQSFQLDNMGLSLNVQNVDGAKHLVVAKAEGLAARAGLRRGDEILAVGQTSVEDEATFRSAIEGAGKNVPLLVQRSGNTLFLALNLP
ncbi:MAG: PDZ domain-containing protein, partial [Neisseria sp.]|nr:PDZ domain-containing protein [Neisseria sp.]